MPDPLQTAAIIEPLQETGQVRHELGRADALTRPRDHQPTIHDKPRASAVSEPVLSMRQQRGTLLDRARDINHSMPSEAVD